MNTTRIFWNRKAEDWALLTHDPSSYYARRTLWVTEMIGRTMEPGSALDAGCGTGALSYALAQRGFDVYGTDISERMVQKARLFLSRTVPDADSRFRVAIPGVFPFEGEFDLVTAIGVFPYVSDYDWYLKYLAQQVRPGGYIVASCTNRASIYTARMIREHIRKFSRRREWLDVLLNIIRTGVWSGGYVDYHAANQCYDAASFDRLFRDNSFRLEQSLDLFNIEAMDLDAEPLDRQGTLRWLARHVGWNHIGMYRKVR